jgi:prepilin-type N-terminal cleavage/methylation domain-containing protein
MRRRGGFTLLETLVALAIAAVVLSALYGAVARAAVARERPTRSAERASAARTLLLRLASELEATTTLTGARQRGAPCRRRPPDAPSWSTLRFATRDVVAQPPTRSASSPIASRPRPAERREGPLPGASMRASLTDSRCSRACASSACAARRERLARPVDGAALPRAVEIAIGTTTARGTDELRRAWRCHPGDT